MKSQDLNKKRKVSEMTAAATDKKVEEKPAEKVEKPWEQKQE